MPNIENIGENKIEVKNSSESFDLQFVESAFKRSLLNSEDIELKSYLDAYEELCKLVVYYFIV